MAATAEAAFAATSEAHPGQISGTLPPKAPVYQRAIARFISDSLSKSVDYDVHWVAVVAEDSVAESPVRPWTQALADSELVVSVMQGHSEGMLLHVLAMPNRYKPDQVEALWRIKLLCGHDRAFDAARDLSKLLRSAEFEAVTTPHVQAELG